MPKLSDADPRCSGIRSDYDDRVLPVSMCRTCERWRQANEDARGRADVMHPPAQVATMAASGRITGGAWLVCDQRVAHDHQDAPEALQPPTAVGERTLQQSTGEGTPQAEAPAPKAKPPKGTPRAGTLNERALKLVREAVLMGLGGVTAPEVQIALGLADVHAAQIILSTLRARGLIERRGPHKGQGSYFPAGQAPAEDVEPQAPAVAASPERKEQRIVRLHSLSRAGGEAAAVNLGGGGKPAGEADYSRAVHTVCPSPPVYSRHQVPDGALVVGAGFMAEWAAKRGASGQGAR